MTDRASLLNRKPVATRIGSSNVVFIEGHTWSEADFRAEVDEDGNTDYVRVSAVLYAVPEEMIVNFTSELKAEAAKVGNRIEEPGLEAASRRSQLDVWCIEHGIDAFNGAAAIAELFFKRLQ